MRSRRLPFGIAVSVGYLLLLGLQSLVSVHRYYAWSVNQRRRQIWVMTNSSIASLMISTIAESGESLST